MNFGANFTRKKAVAINNEKALELWREGATDAELMYIFDVSISTVRKFRREYNLARNESDGVRKPLPKRQVHLSKLEKDAIAASEAGMTYGQWKAQQEYLYGKR